jgi:S1-C subfamily serine protease
MSDETRREDVPRTDPVVMPQSPPYMQQEQPPYAQQQQQPPYAPPGQPQQPWVGQWPPPSPPPPPSIAAPPVAPPPPGPPPVGGPNWTPQPPEPHKNSARTAAVVALVLALVCAAAGYGIGASVAHDRSSRASASAPSTTSSDSSGSSDSSSSSDTSSQALPSPSTGSGNNSSKGNVSASDIADKVDPSIVDINVTFTSGSGAGTGIVLTSDGLVLTNNHVIANATKIEAESVTTGDTWSANVLGYDITDDVALIQLQHASGLKAASVGDSDNVQTGDAVVALGNALGQGGAPAVAQGQVSQLDQSIEVNDEDGSTSTLAGLIETTARLQPGDSGGPLVDSSGLVIGMDAAATTSQRGRTTNDSYAIPINTALDIAHKIQSGQESAKIHVGDRGLLGVESQDGTSATIAGVESGSPAETAGLQSGDTITAIDGNAVHTVEDIIAALDSHHPGDSVQVTWVDTSGQRHGASIKLIAGPPA